MMKSGLAIYALSYPFKAAVKLMCSYCYATEKFVLSNLLTYIDPVVTTPLLLAVLPHYIGSDGVWATMTASQIIVTAIGILLMVRKVHVSGSR